MSFIEMAKSSRASCRICKLKIEKLTPRLGIKSSFEMRGRIVESLRWHHLECSFEKLGEEVANAEIQADLSTEDIKKINRIKSKFLSSGLDAIGISDLTEHGVRKNVKATVLKPMRVREIETDSGKTTKARTVYVESDKIRRKIVLWSNQVEIELKPEDQLLIIRGLTELGSDDKILVNVDENAKILINPSDEQTKKITKAPKIFTSDQWKRPSGTHVKFEIAKTSRAKCFLCGDKILKGELKIVKPVWIENEMAKRHVPGSYSLHLKHALDDEDGAEVLQEAISRISHNIIDDFGSELIDLRNSTENSKIKKLLDEVLIN